MLFKAYYDAGLKDIAQKCGFKASTLTSVSQCSNWRITHNFIMQVSETIYRCMLVTFMQHRNELDLCSFPSHHFLSARIEAAIADQLEDCSNFSCPSDIRGIIIAIQNMLSTDFKSLEDEFMQLVTHFSEIDATWRFWVRFMIEDFASYLALFIGVRTRSWNLHMAGVKEMAPLFVVFDRPTYRKLIPHHLTEVLLMPNEVLLHLKKWSILCIHY